jgi:hypothetical protein
MHKSFIITEEDKNRILGMHENATKRQYLNEQTSNDACLVKLGGKKDEQGVYWVTNKEGKWGYYPDGRYHKDGSNNWGYYHCDGDKLVYKNKCVGDCQNGKGTLILADGGKYTGDFIKGTAEGKGVFDYTNGEKYTGDWKNGKREGKGTYTWTDGAKYVGQFKDDNFNGKGSYKNPNGYVWSGEFKDDSPVGTDWDTLNKKVIPTWKPELENCVKSSGGRKDEQGVYWVTNKEGKWGYYPDGRYHKDGSNNWGHYYCNANKIAYSKTPVNSSTQALPIPTELKNEKGVRDFQTWMELKHKGWYKGNNPIDGKFGPQTKAAWGTYGKIYLNDLKNNSFNVNPISPSVDEPTLPNTTA